nr:unnamed protein product [Callosobruchus analis]
MWWKGNMGYGRDFLVLEIVLAVIVATAVLYNLAIQENEYEPEDWIENLETDEGKSFI